MKVYISPHEEMILCTAAGVHRFAGGKYVAKTKKEVEEIEKSKDFGRRFFEFKEPELVEEDQEKPDEGENISHATEDKKEKGEYVCEICGASFPVKIALIGHMRSHETKEK